MCRALALMFAVLLCFSAVAFGDLIAAKEETFVYAEENSAESGGEQAQSALKNPLANVQRIRGEVTAERLQETKSDVCLFSAEECADFEKVFAVCQEKNIVPTVFVNDTAESQAVLRGAEKASFSDLTVVSRDGDVLRALRKENELIRTGLVLKDEEIDPSDAGAINELRKKVRVSPATFCILEGKSASRELVSGLQELAVSVWVEVSEEFDTEAWAVEALGALTTGANGIVSESAEAVSSLINLHFAENSMTRTPLLIGHRGNPTQAPENSLSGFLTAYENGCDGIELDVRLTADGEVIVLHDASLKRTTDYTGSAEVSSMTLAEIREYKLLGADKKPTQETVPTLKEVFLAFQDKDCTFLVEIKSRQKSEVVRATAEVIQETQMESRVNVIAYSSEFLALMRAALPGVSTGVLTSYNASADTPTDARKALELALIDAQKEESAIHTANGVVTALFEKAATDRGLPVWSYTYTAATNNAAFLSYCDSITTNDAQWAKDMVKEIRVEEGRKIKVEQNAQIRLSVLAETYGGAISEISEDELIVSVLTGEDLAHVDGRTIHTLDRGGEITVLFGYPTTTALWGTEYVLYTEPVTLQIEPDFLETLGGKILLFSLPVPILLFGAGTVILISKKSKKR